MVRRSKEDREKILARVLGRSEDERVVSAKFRDTNDATLPLRVLQAIFGDDAEWHSLNTNTGPYRVREINLAASGLSQSELREGMEILWLQLRAGEMMIEPQGETVRLRIEAGRFAGARQIAKDMLKPIGQERRP